MMDEVAAPYEVELAALAALTPESPLKYWEAGIEAQLEKVRDAYQDALNERDEVLEWIVKHRDAVKNIEVKRLLDKAEVELQAIPEALE
jgi:hypothetical protein